MRTVTLHPPRRQGLDSDSGSFSSLSSSDVSFFPNTPSFGSEQESKQSFHSFFDQPPTEQTRPTFSLFYNHQEPSSVPYPQEHKSDSGFNEDLHALCEKVATSLIMSPPEPARTPSEVLFTILLLASIFEFRFVMIIFLFFTPFFSRAFSN